MLSSSFRLAARRHLSSLDLCSALAVRIAEDQRNRISEIFSEEIELFGYEY